MKNFSLSLTLLSIFQIHTMNNTIETEPTGTLNNCLNAFEKVEALVSHPETPILCGFVTGKALTSCPEFEEKRRILFPLLASCLPISFLVEKGSKEKKYTKCLEAPNKCLAGCGAGIAFPKLERHKN